MAKVISKPESITPEKTRHHAEILANRIRKRFAHLSKRFKRQHIDCFRLFDWDIPEVRAVVDWYAGHAVVAEYERWQTSDEWLPAMAQAVAQALNLPPEKTHIKRRHTKTEEGPRYKRISSRNERFPVSERDLKFWVNLDDFLDTGLYSDHRDTRVLIRGLAKDKDFLNLFAYAGAFTCAAAAGGARTTTTVDRSSNYIKWAQDNLELSGFWNIKHRLIQSDVDKFLDKTAKESKRFNLAFVDPPSFFKDFRSRVSFDINEDHPKLLADVLKVMVPGSLLFFSTNHQRFEPRLNELKVKEVTDITLDTIPEDYRNKQVHRCWRIVV